MQVISSIKELFEVVSAWKKQGLTVAFVPTMGNLHAGHIGLVKQAKTLADKVVVSVFVNPLQFAENEDFDSYPRTLKDDELQLIQIKNDLLFSPKTTEIYPKSVNLPPPHDSFLYEVLEGKSRPGHFAGVVQVVSRLFELVQPDIAIFGQKDYQQCLVLKQMVSGLNMPIKMVCADIAREEDGLALSSRNQYLNPQQRAVAPAIYRILNKTKQVLSIKTDLIKLEAEATEELLKAGFDSVDYYKILDANNLKAVTKATDKLVILTVARLGKTRLLDNLITSLV